MQNLTNIQTYFLIGGLLLLLIFLSAFFGMTLRQEQLILNQLHTSANALFDNILLTRRWNANYGGVYVQKGPGIESNPYLEKPDIVTQEGIIYTMKNPALMTREISVYAHATDRFAYHITSLKLINPSNAPDEWEISALRQFERGVTEMKQITIQEGRKVFRLMRPLTYESGCVKCHAKQGYQIGQVRGGISVSLPFEETSAILKTNRIAMGALGVAVSFILGFVLYFFVWRLMNQLRFQNMQLAELNHQKNEFLGMAAHDLRNPLTGIKGYADLLLSDMSGQINEKQEKFLNRIGDSTTNMLNLINDLLDIAKIESGKLELQPRLTDLAQLLRENYQINHMIAKNKNIDLVLEMEPGVPEINIDPLRINQVMDNLISNAIKFSHPKTTVTVKLRSLVPEKKNQIEISVTDQGQGIPPGEISQIFEEFHRTSVSPTAGEKSTGLGLAIVKKILDGHQGQIRVESQVGLGTTFYITLPIPEY